MVIGIELVDETQEGSTAVPVRMLMLHPEVGQRWRACGLYSRLAGVRFFRHSGKNHHKEADVLFHLRRLMKTGCVAAALVLANVAAAPKALAVDSYTLSCGEHEVKATKGSAGWGYIKITVRNGCLSSKRVKVYVSNNLDTACLSYSPGQTREFVYSWPSDLDRIAYC